MNGNRRNIMKNAMTRNLYRRRTNGSSNIITNFSGSIQFLITLFRNDAYKISKYFYHLQQMKTLLMRFRQCRMALQCCNYCGDFARKNRRYRWPDKWAHNHLTLWSPGIKYFVCNVSVFIYFAFKSSHIKRQNPNF